MCTSTCTHYSCCMAPELQYSACLFIHMPMITHQTVARVMLVCSLSVLLWFFLTFAVATAGPVAPLREGCGLSIKPKGLLSGLTAQRLCTDRKQPRTKASADLTSLHLCSLSVWMTSMWAFSLFEVWSPLSSFLQVSFVFDKSLLGLHFRFLCLTFLHYSHEQHIMLLYRSLQTPRTRAFNYRMLFIHKVTDE